MEPALKLSVLMITYNHEQYIAQALDSVLMQQVDFDYEIVVGEDCSSDATRSILLGYRDQHPDRIRLLLPEKNLGMMPNFMRCFEACRGDYIAMLEGDDFWTSSTKLQSQVDFLDSHPECAACFHNAQVTYEGAQKPDHLCHEKPLQPFFTQEEILAKFFIPTCSTMFRNRLFDGFPEWFATLPMGDWPLHVLNAEHGSFGYLDQVMASYRVHDGGVWSMVRQVDQIQKTVYTARLLNRHLDYRYARLIGRKIAMLEYETASHLVAEGNDGVLRHLGRAFSAAPCYPKLYRRVLFKLSWRAVRALFAKRKPPAAGA